MCGGIFQPIGKAIGEQSGLYWVVPAMFWPQGCT